MSVREQQILALLRDDPMISQAEIADKLGLSRSGVAGHIMNLTNKGIIKGRGYVFDDAPFAVVIGGANIDILGIPARALVLHDSNPGIVHTSPGGVARNIAENLARLGSDCRLISAVGNDHYGDLILRQGRAAGIDMQHVAQLNTAQTSTYMSVLNKSGEMYVALSDMSVIAAVDVNYLREHETLLKQAALIVADTNLTDDSLAWLTTTFRESALFIDTVSTTKARKIRPYLINVHTLKPSLIEAEALSGIDAGNREHLPKMAQWFHDQGVTRVFITLGAEGVYFSTGSARGTDNLKMKTKKIDNAGGAGDAFMAGLAHAWLQDWNLQKTLRFSLSAAQSALSNPDNINPALSVEAMVQA